MIGRISSARSKGGADTRATGPPGRHRLDTRQHPLQQWWFVSPERPVTTLPESVAVDVRRFPGVRRLAAEYTTNFAALEGFFAGNPADETAWRTATAGRQRPPGTTTALTTLLHAQQRARDAPTAAVDAARRLDDPHSVAVVTGQQAGLFGGPLYTLLKAISAIRLARRVEQIHGVAGRGRILGGRGGP